MKNSFPKFLLSLNFVDGTTIVKNIEDISLTEGKGTVSHVLQTFMERAISFNNLVREYTFNSGMLLLALVWMKFVMQAATGI